MELRKFEFHHSLKNIPIPKRDYYLKVLIAKTEEFIQRLRWKVFYYLNPPRLDVDRPNRFGFKTTKTAPQNDDLTPFETELYELIANIKFDERKQNGRFQRELDRNIRDINKSEELFVVADKTSNIYKVSPADYNKLLNDTITKDYKQTTRDVISDIDLENREIAGRLDIIDRMEQLSENCGYISIKDHKEDFRTNPKCRLINPAKNDMGKVSKQILQKINNEIRSKLDLNQWHSTQTVLDWFGMIKRKTVKRFFQLDIVDFYPSISETLLDEALTFAEAHASINDTEKDIIKQARKSLLFSQPTNNRNAAKIPWTKKSGLFDVTMGAADGAEVCELVGLLLLKEIQQEFSQYNMDFGLYRDDGLAAHSRIPPPQLDRIRKDMHKLFGKHGLKITMSQNCSLERVDFLDVTMNLPKESYEPYRKPNSTPQYVNVGSNHPPNVISQIPRSIEKRLSSISSSQEIFDAAAPPTRKPSLTAATTTPLHTINNPPASQMKQRPTENATSCGTTPPTMLQ